MAKQEVAATSESSESKDFQEDPKDLMRRRKFAWACILGFWVRTCA